MHQRLHSDGNVDFKANEVYEYITVPTSNQFLPVYEIYNGKLRQKIFSNAEFKTYFRRAV
jgi:hypothetical protein